MRIYLTGFMGAGKTSVGGNLAKLLGCPALDLDREVEIRSNLTIREIFERQGEAAFRELEHACLKETARLENVVVATGGGAMTFPRNVEVMRQLGISVWLNLSFDTIINRMSPYGRAKRPLFQDPEQARQLFQQRLAAYRQSDVTMDVASCDHSPDVAARIALRLREERCDI